MKFYELRKMENNCMKLSETRFPFEPEKANVKT